MYKFTLYFGLLTISLLSLSSLHSQSASFSTWKDNKKAAYSIIHDDFGSGVPSIFAVADTIATARGIKLCFGAITNSCGPTEWANARTMITHGHECINHSHNHKCGGAPSDCIGVATYGPAQFVEELDQSTQLIQTNTGVRPLFFAHPYDAYTPAILTYLQNNLGYLGSRAGVPGDINTSSFTNFMNLNFASFNGTAQAISSLRTTLDAGIIQGAYVVSELHGIEDASASPIKKVDYTTHLDYVKSKITDGSVWSATVSEVLTYKMQRDAYALATVYNAIAGTINVNFTNTKTINTAILKTPITVNVDLASIADNFTVTQGTTTLTAARNGNIVSFNVYPHQGNVVLKKVVVVQPNNVLNFYAISQPVAMALSWTNPTTSFDEVMIVAKAATAFSTQPTGTVYTANPSFTGTGTAFEGGKVVYRGTGTIINITGLTNGTLYHFKAFSRFGAIWSSGVAVSATPMAIPANSLASFATWKDNKKAAYTIIHDDFGSAVPSIFTEADPIATARGIKICFGAITNSCSPTDWANARTMIAHGHECVNHTHNHKCGGPASTCTGVPTYGPAQFAEELDISTQFIQVNTGVRPLFLVHPFDSYSSEILNHLNNNLGYLGSRAGISGSPNSKDFTNFMTLNFAAFDGSAAAVASLRSTLDGTINVEGGYLVNEFHGIEDASAGPIKRADYIAHLDYVKTKIADGSIWSATASEAITYKMQRDAFGISTIYNAVAGTINVNFIALSTINTAILKTPVTVNVNLGTITGTFLAKQGSTTIPTTKVGNILSFNVYPHQGNVILQTTITAPQPNEVLNFIATPQSTAVALSWANPATNFDEVLIVAKPITAFTTQPSGTSYIADTLFTGIGTAFEGGKVVYRGNSRAATITGLTNGSLYHFKAFSRLGTVWSTGVAVSATPAAGVINPVLGCLKASYFSNKTLTGTPVITKGESKIDYNWGAGAPIIGLPANQFSARWEGTITPPVTGLYTFTATVDDGVRLWVNDILIINKWIDQSATTHSATMNLVQGQAISIRVEYYENTGNASIKLEWTIPTQAKRIIAFNACPLGGIFNPALCYRLEARHSNRAMNLLKDTITDGVALVQSTWTGAVDQVWRIKQVDATHYQLVNGLTGKVATVKGGSTSNLTPIVQSPFVSTNNQLWKFDQNTEGYYTITAKHSNKAIDVNGASTAQNATLIQYGSNGGTNQQWRIESVGCPAGVAALVSNRVVAFNGHLENNKGQLSWIVSSEDLKDYYEIEKMDETQNFRRLDILNGNSPDALRSFYYTDETLIDGENIYRLKSVGSDGTIQTSDLVKINYYRPEIYALSPNPTTETVDIDLTSALGKRVELALITNLGKVVKEEKIESVSAPHHTWTFDNLENGQYFLKIQTQGKRLVMKKLVIIK
jgi:peptidoglycan/xylan/chitin deacetylase (PgdA/CDA1 family)